MMSGRLDNYLDDMKKDVVWMTGDEFVEKYGENMIDFFDELQAKWLYDLREPDDVG